MTTNKLYPMHKNKVMIAALLGIALATGACRRETKDEQVQRVFAEFTQKECPKFVDPYTRLDSARYDIAEKTLSYHYTVTDSLDNELLFTDELIGDFQDNVLRELKSSIAMRSYKEMGITFRYDYRSQSTGKMMLDLTFTPDDYRN
ncbi:MAG: hypothetical protein IJ615_02895 [Bacteroidaceae bacterium]|nr:hypothetical protein [Bacteroidaceae bacterium]